MLLGYEVASDFGWLSEESREFFILPNKSIR